MACAGKLIENCCYLKLFYKNNKPGAFSGYGFTGVIKPTKYVERTLQKLCKSQAFLVFSHAISRVAALVSHAGITIQYNTVYCVIRLAIKKVCYHIRLKKAMTTEKNS